MKSPKTLNIRRSDISAIKEELVPQKEISDKSKNLDKLGDFKISPMDASLLLQNKKDKTDESTADSNDNECIASCEALPSVSRNCEEPSNSTISTISNAEAAMSFDNLLPVETLSNVMLKSRAKITTKRRPQSREARKRALECSNTDYDMQCW